MSEWRDSSEVDFDSAVPPRSRRISLGGSNVRSPINTRRRTTLLSRKEINAVLEESSDDEGKTKTIKPSSFYKSPASKNRPQSVDPSLLISDDQISKAKPPAKSRKAKDPTSRIPRVAANTRRRSMLVTNPQPVLIEDVPLNEEQLAAVKTPHREAQLQPQLVLTSVSPPRTRRSRRSLAVTRNSGETPLIQKVKAEEVVVSPQQEVQISESGPLKFESSLNADKTSQFRKTPTRWKTTDSGEHSTTKKSRKSVIVTMEKVVEAISLDSDITERTTNPEPSEAKHDSKAEHVLTPVSPPETRRGRQSSAMTRNPVETLLLQEVKAEEVVVSPQHEVQITESGPLKFKSSLNKAQTSQSRKTPTRRKTTNYGEQSTTKKSRKSVIVSMEEVVEAISSDSDITEGTTDPKLSDAKDGSEAEHVLSGKSSRVNLLSVATEQMASSTIELSSETAPIVESQSSLNAEKSELIHSIKFDALHKIEKPTTRKSVSKQSSVAIIKGNPIVPTIIEGGTDLSPKESGVKNQPERKSGLITPVLTQSSNKRKTPKTNQNDNIPLRTSHKTRTPSTQKPEANTTTKRTTELTTIIASSENEIPAMRATPPRKSAIQKRKGTPPRTPVVAVRDVRSRYKLENLPAVSSEVVLDQVKQRTKTKDAPELENVEPIAILNEAHPAKQPRLSTGRNKPAVKLTYLESPALTRLKPSIRKPTPPRVVASRSKQAAERIVRMRTNVQEQSTPGHTPPRSVKKKYPTTPYKSRNPQPTPLQPIDTFSTPLAEPNRPANQTLESSHLFLTPPSSVDNNLTNDESLGNDSMECDSELVEPEVQAAEGRSWCTVM